MDTEPLSGDSGACVWVDSGVAGIAVGLERVVVGVTWDSSTGDVQPVAHAPRSTMAISPRTRRRRGNREVGIVESDKKAGPAMAARGASAEVYHAAPIAGRR